MGGKALGYTTVRLTRTRYFEVADKCVNALQLCYPKNRLGYILSYREKESFGDLDILVSAEGFDRGEAAEAVLGGTGAVYNGPVTSFGLLLQEGVFQVDLITIPEKSFEFAYSYFAWNDLGNLLGRVARSMGVVLKHEGLFFYVENEHGRLGEIKLTDNFADALSYLGYDYSVFDKGFDSLNDIYSYVVSSEFFGKDSFLLENRNAAGRARDRKRPVYLGFLDFCEKLTGSSVYDREFYIERIKKHFPLFEEEYAKVWALEERRKQLKQKFNGKIVMELTGLSGIDLRLRMKQLSDRFDSDQMKEEFILKSSEKEIANWIKGYTIYE
jgi:hypothetical protein